MPVENVSMLSNKPSRVAFRPGRWFSPSLAMALVVIAGGCATDGTTHRASDVAPHYKIGKPYKVAGKTYRPARDDDYDRVGLASWYGPNFHGKATANGEVFNKNDLTAAHKTLPLPSIVSVENLENGKRVVVRVNDRGPFVDDRLIDLSEAAARRLGFHSKGLAKVRVKYLRQASLPGERSNHRRSARVASKSVLDVPAPAKKKSQTSKPKPSVVSIKPKVVKTVNASAPVEPSSGAAPIELWVELVPMAALDDIVQAQDSIPSTYETAIFEVLSSDGAFSLQIGPFNSASDADMAVARMVALGFTHAKVMRVGRT